MNKSGKRRIHFLYKKVLEKFSYLNIKNLYTPLDDKSDYLYDRYYHLNKNSIEKFPFHNNGVIDKEKLRHQKDQAEKIFIKKIYAISEPVVYTTLSIDGTSSWAEIETKSLINNLHLFITDTSCDFFLFADNGVSLQLYRAEYAWEILQSDIQE